MFLKTFLAVVVVFTANSSWADGVAQTLTDPPVVPLVRAPSSDFQPLGAGVLAGPTAGAQTGPTTIVGYPVRIAWDHIAVGGAILGVLYLLGESDAAGASF